VFQFLVDLCLVYDPVSQVIVIFGSPQPQRLKPHAVLLFLIAFDYSLDDSHNIEISRLLFEGGVQLY
jgi:hypothetical protein